MVRFGRTFSGICGFVFPVMAAAAAGGTAWVWQQPADPVATEAARPLAAASPDVIRKAIDLPPFIYDPESHAPAEFSVPVVNFTSEPVRFSDIKTSCGCTSAKLDQETLEPGAETKLRLSISVHGVSGTRTVSVYLIPESGPRWEYSLRLPTHPRIAFKPNETLFGVLDPGSSVQREVVLETYAPAGSAPLEVANVMADHPALRTTLLGSELEILETNVVQRSTRARIELAATVEPGLSSGRLVARCAPRDGEGAVEAAHNVVWSVRSQYRISPPRIVLIQDSDAVAIVEKRVLVSRADGKALSLQSARSTHPVVLCRLAESYRSRCERELIIAVDQSGIDRSMWTEVLVDTDDPAEPVLKIPVVVLQPRSGQQLHCCTVIYGDHTSSEGRKATHVSNLFIGSRRTGVRGAADRPLRREPQPICRGSARKLRSSV